MSRTVYVNGQYVPESEASISVFDRGFLFADGIYEVTAVLNGRLMDFEGHVARLHRSLNELNMHLTLNDNALRDIHRQLIEKNDLQEGLVYLQVTRGVADRDFAYPDASTPVTLVAFTQQKAIIDSPLAERGLRVISLPDMRWGRRDIKTVQLLYPSMAKMEAKKRGADDAWLVESGLVTEASSSNAWIVDHDNTLITRELSRSLLHGITRRAVMQLARQHDMKVEERGFTIKEAQNAREAFVTSATSLVYPVISIDQRSVGDGTPGDIAKALRRLYIEAGLSVSSSEAEQGA
ncbi:D-alanine aminotransferase [Kushneria pakistanensis]|uniref:branched-chain-amino-acid transaminase n=1 Tax=Kushneria pakistanensis TaxID=1508770 RepID=A0ABQ3FJI7_9GAMM|nr:D-amino-acid transaminase [Kushneria pakistanensis]GHC27033.1 D-alanine aminotransferase [Kushneria pakistanensis]